MTDDEDKERLLDALYSQKQYLPATKRPSILEAQMQYLPEWDRERLFHAAEALESAGDILNLSPGLGNVDLSSTAHTRARARAEAPQNSTVFNIGSLQNSPLQNISPGGHGEQHTNYQINVDDLRSIIDTYREHVDSLNLSTTDRKRADKAVATLEAQIVDDDPDHTIVRSAGRSLRTIVEGAIGGALGNIASNPATWAGLLSIFA